MRAAMESAVKPDDLIDIMSAQVKEAKAGNRKAAAFVLDQIQKMAKAETRPVTLTQNVFYDTPPEKRPDAPSAVNGSAEKVNKMARRHAAGIPLHLPGDGPQPMSDDEEKEYRRRQQAAEVDDTRGPEGD
jgi:hypothetical protein